MFVRPFPNVQDARWPVSTTGGSRPAWAKTGRELFYLDRDRLLTSVAVSTPGGSAFSAGRPERILETTYLAGNTTLGLPLRAYDVAPDGQRFLMIKEPEVVERPSEAARVVVVLNWAEELKARLPIP